MASPQVSSQNLIDAYQAVHELRAQTAPPARAQECDRTHSGGAAASLRGGREKLIVLRLGVPSSLARTLGSTLPPDRWYRRSRTPARSSNGATAELQCADARGVWSGSVGGSTESVRADTYRRFTPYKTMNSPNQPDRSTRMTSWAQHDAHRDAAEVRRSL